MRGGVRDRRGAETGLVGEGAPAQAPDDRLTDRDARRAAEHRPGRKRRRENLPERLPDAAEIAENDDERHKYVRHAHKRYELFRYLADALDAAEEDERREQRKADAEPPAQRRLTAEAGVHGAHRVRHRADDGVGLRHIADAERRERRQHAERPGKPLPLAAHAVFNIVHRAADPVAARVPLAELDGKQNLGILDDHAEQRRDPQPEHRAVAAHGDRLRRADDVARADGRGKRRRHGLQRRYAPVRRLLLFEELPGGVFHRIAEAAELYRSAAYGQIDSSGEHARQQDVQPRHVVQRPRQKPVQPVVINCHCAFPLFFRVLSKNNM